MNCTIQEPKNSAPSNAKIDLPWLSTITADIDQMAQLKFAEELKTSEARIHMAAYELLRNFRQSFSKTIRAIDGAPCREAEKLQLFESAKCLDEARAISTEIEDIRQRYDTNMAIMRKICA